MTHEQPLGQVQRDRPQFPLAATAIVFAVFAADVSGKIKVDGWAVALLIIAVFPWCFAAILQGLRLIGGAFRDFDIETFKVGVVEITRLKQQVNEQDQKITEQRKILDNLLLYSMSYYIYKKLEYLYKGTKKEYKNKFGEYIYHNDDPSNHDLRYLRDHGYLEMFQFSDLKEGENLVGRLQVTDMGSRFVELNDERDHVRPSDASPSRF